MSSIEQQDEQIVQEIVGQVMNVTLDDENVDKLDDHHNNSSPKLNNDESIALEVSNLNACDVSTDYTDSEEANKKDESLHSPKEEKQQMNISSMSEGKDEAAVTANSFGDDSSVLGGKNDKEVSAMTNGIGDESSLPHESDNLMDEGVAKKEESSPPSLKEEEDGKQKKDISTMEGNGEVSAMTTATNGVGEESDPPFNSTAGQNGGDHSSSVLEVLNLLDVSATDSDDNLEKSTKTAIPPTPKEGERQQKDISMLEVNKNEVPAMVAESGEESDLAPNSAGGQNDKDGGNDNIIANNDMDSDTAANGDGAEEGKVEPKQQPPQKTNKTKMCSVL